MNTKIKLDELEKFFKNKTDDEEMTARAVILVCMFIWVSTSIFVAFYSFK